MIGNILQTLQNMGALKSVDSQAILDQAKGAGLSVESFLIDQKMITPVELAQAYAQMLSLVFIDVVAEKMADPNMLSAVQFNFLRQHLSMPIMYEGNPSIVVADPFNLAVIDEISMLLGKELQVLVATPAVIVEGINRYYPLEGAKQMLDELEEDSSMMDNELDIGQLDDQDILSMASQAPVVKLVNHILFQAVKRDASDIHIEPFEKEVRVRYRVDGVMHLAFTPPKRIQGALVSRLKIMANLNIAEKRLPQDGRIEIRVADKAFDIRVSVLPVAYGERVVMRMLDKSKAFTSLQDLGLSEYNYKIIEHVVQRPNGIILVSGPTGSGKTTTLYSVLSKLNSPDSNIITVEDPVEYQIAGVNQVQVQDKIGLTFAAALRSILRQDPDTVMIGETRDVETAQIAVQAALTGHLVLSTIHTNNAPATITRLVDMGIEPFLISSSVIAIVAQRLVRKLCNSCKEKYTPSGEQLKSVGLSEQDASSIVFYKPVGCEKCMNLGYKGRLAIFEIMTMSNDIARLVVDKADANVLRQQALQDGMRLLIQDGVEKIKQGLTTIEEVLSVATAQEDL